MFLPLDQFPEIEALGQQMKADAYKLRMCGEFFRDSFTGWPEPLHEGGWDVLPLKWQGEISLEALASTFRWLRDPLVWNAGLSRLAPGTVIKPHAGYTDEVLRLHLGLDCPEGASITVAGEERAWRKDELLLFDDTLEHSARNLGDRPRLILLVDVKKPG